jgi:HlyD family secretion protein
MRFNQSAIIAAALALVAALSAACSRPPTGSFQGYLEGEFVYVAAPLGGALTNLAVARGDSVKAGQLLFQLEHESEAADVRQAEQNLAQANASLTRSENEFIRRQKLRADNAGVISAEELDQARARRDADEAQVAAQKAALAKAQWSLDQKQQFAPADAQVHDTLYRQGEWVVAGNPIIALLPPGNIKVRFFVPQEMLPKIKPGDAVKVSFDGAAKSYSATINYISSQAEFTPPVLYNRENRAKLVYLVEAKFSQADAVELRPGQPADVKLQSLSK